MKYQKDMPLITIQIMFLGYIIEQKRNMHIANHRHDRVTPVSCNAKAINIKRTCLYPCIFYRISPKP